MYVAQRALLKFLVRPRSASITFEIRYTYPLHSKPTPHPIPQTRRPIISGRKWDTVTVDRSHRFISTQRWLRQYVGLLDVLVLAADHHVNPRVLHCGDAGARLLHVEGRAVAGVSVRVDVREGERLARLGILAGDMDRGGEATLDRGVKAWPRDSSTGDSWTEQGILIPIKLGGR